MEVTLKFARFEFLEVFTPILKSLHKELSDDLAREILQAMFENFCELGEASYEWLSYDLANLRFLSREDAEDLDDFFTIYYQNESLVVCVKH